MWWFRDKFGGIACLDQIGGPWVKHPCLDSGSRLGRSELWVAPNLNSHTSTWARSLSQSIPHASAKEKKEALQVLDLRRAWLNLLISLLVFVFGLNFLFFEAIDPATTAGDSLTTLWLLAPAPACAWLAWRRLDLLDAPSLSFSALVRLLFRACFLALGSTMLQLFTLGLWGYWVWFRWHRRVALLKSAQSATSSDFPHL